jgi:hypothetical protein
MILVPLSTEKSIIACWFSATPVPSYLQFFFLCLYSPCQALAASMKLSVSLQLLVLGQSVGLLGRVISSSQGLYLYTNTEKRTHNTNTKHPCPEWDLPRVLPLNLTYILLFFLQPLNLPYVESLRST